MISVLIPSFNRDITALVKLLSRQAEACAVQVEIIVIDDASSEAFRKCNSAISELPFVRYSLLDQNHGRIRIRQLLAEDATYDWLIFLDCDSSILSDDFLQAYVAQLHAGSDAVTGGRVYSGEPPADCRYRLHWKYGSNRERVHDNGKGYPLLFMTSNILIRKSVFAGFRFDDAWKGYGYEDTWMGIQLEQTGGSFSHIDNAVLHDGVEQATEFIAKSEAAMRNLLVLERLVPEEMLARHVRLYSFFRTLRSFRLLWAVKTFFPLIRKFVMDNLVSCRPSLILFDLYRLHYFIGLHNNSRTGNLSKRLNHGDKAAQRSTRGH